MLSEKFANEPAAPIRGEGSAYYSSSSRVEISAFKPEGGVQMSSDPSDQGFINIGSASGSPNPGPSFIQRHAFPGVGTRYYVPAEKLVLKAASGYQFCAPTTGLQQGDAMESSTGPLHSCQQPEEEEASRKRELRLMKNRQAAKECRRRKREYINCLESHVAMLQEENKKLMEEINYLKGISDDKLSSKGQTA